MTARWRRFIVVGAGGFVVQLGTLWLLTNRGRLHYLVATAIATELAILLNFFCHRWWTWADRPAGEREGLRRFLRFHISNGAISLVGGALLMPALVEMGRVHYLLANLLTVGVCSLANFLAADRVVFRPALALTLALLAGGSRVDAAELRTDTINAFDRYVRLTESRIESELGGGVPFLWVDRLTQPDRQDVYARLKRGDIAVSRLRTQDRGRTIDCPNGLIHHWIGTTFLAGTALDRTVALMQGYDRYQDIYAPNVRSSHTINREGDRFTVYLQLFMKKVIGVVLNTENDVRYTRVNASRMYVRSYSTRIAEVQRAGTPGEVEEPIGRDNGFLWRFYNYCSLEERADGTYVQCESLSLSRAVPTGLGWLIDPFVTSIPRESLEFTLGSMRKALIGGR